MKVRTHNGSMSQKEMTPVAPTAPCCKSEQIREQQKRFDCISKSIVCPDIVFIN